MDNILITIKALAVTLLILVIGVSMFVLSFVAVPVLVVIAVFALAFIMFKENTPTNNRRRPRR